MVSSRCQNGRLSFSKEYSSNCSYVQLQLNPPHKQQYETVTGVEFASIDCKEYKRLTSVL